MSQASDPILTLFTLHGLAVSLRDRADTISERAEAPLTHVEGAIAQQMAGEPIVLGIRPRPAPMTPGAALPAPRGAGLCPSGAQRGAPTRPRYNLRFRVVDFGNLSLPVYACPELVAVLPTAQESSGRSCSEQDGCVPRTSKL